jgi:hypothetical protein
VVAPLVVLGKGRHASNVGYNVHVHRSAQPCTHISSNTPAVTTQPLQMLNEVGGEVHGTDIIIVNKGAPRRRTLELMEQLAQPGGLSYTIGDIAVLSIRARPGHDRLSLGKPGH